MGTTMIDDTRVEVSMGLELLEAPSGGRTNPDGTVEMVLIRPCNGRGLGSRIYEASMLQRSADMFSGWPMYLNHDTPASRRERGGLPRSPTDLAGVVRESYWDATFTAPHDAELGFDRGAVVGRCALTDQMQALVERVPEAVKLSLNCQATNVRKGERRGKPGWIVEGIVNDPENSSVDFVTKAGAGGQVRTALREAASSRVTRDADRAAEHHEALEGAVARVVVEATDEIRAVSVDARTVPEPPARAPAHGLRSTREQRLGDELAAGLFHAGPRPDSGPPGTLGSYDFDALVATVAPSPARRRAISEAITERTTRLARPAEPRVSDGARARDRVAMGALHGAAMAETPRDDGLPIGTAITEAVTTPAGDAFIEQAKRLGLDPAAYGMSVAS